MRKIVCLTVLLIMPWSASFAAPTAQDLPGVPLEAVRVLDRKSPTKEKVDPPPPPTIKEVSKPKLESLSRRVDTMDPKDIGPVTVKMKPGVNEIIPVSLGHMNRIITPFANPKVVGFTDKEFPVEGSIVYIAPTKEGPITMFITEADSDGEEALSVTLLPEPRPPREIRLEFEKAFMGRGTAFKKAEKWEKGQAYLDTLKQVLRSLALGEIPPGYGLRDPIVSDPVVSCEMEGVTISPGQVLDGHSIIAVVSSVTNVSDSMIEIDEPSCYYKGVLAASAWPHVHLYPGDRTELYVLFKRPEFEDFNGTKRPSLLGGGM